MPVHSPSADPYDDDGFYSPMPSEENERVVSPSHDQVDSLDDDDGPLNRRLNTSTKLASDFSCKDDIGSAKTRHLSPRHSRLKSGKQFNDKIVYDDDLQTVNKTYPSSTTEVQGDRGNVRQTVRSASNHGYEDDYGDDRHSPPKNYLLSPVRSPSHSYDEDFDDEPVRSRAATTRVASRNASRYSNVDDDHYEDDFDQDFHSDSEPQRSSPIRSRNSTPTAPARRNILRKIASPALADDAGLAMNSKMQNSHDETNDTSHNLKQNNRRSISPVSEMPRELQNGSRVLKEIQQRSEGLNTRTGTRNQNISRPVSKFDKNEHSRRKLRSNMTGHSIVSSARYRLNPDVMRREIRDIADEIEGLKLENKALKRNNILLTHQLDKREKEEDDIPQLYDRQVKELQALKDFLRRQKEKYDRTRGRLDKAERELRASQKLERDLEAQAEEEGLKERSRLTKRLQSVEEESVLCEEKIKQLERYAENLVKCHDAELAAEIEHRRESQQQLEKLSQQAGVAKHSIQVKESELERFRIQHTSRLTLSRAHISTSLSGHVATTGHSSAAGHHHLKALPAPTPPSQSDSKELVLSEQMNSSQLTPSPPTTSRNSTLSNSRYNRLATTTAASPDKSTTKARLQQHRKPPQANNTNRTQRQLASREEELRRSLDEERRRAEGVVDKFEREDSWEAIMAADDAIRKTRADVRSSEGVTANTSLREQTFAVASAAEQS